MGVLFFRETLAARVSILACGASLRQTRGQAAIVFGHQGSMLAKGKRACQGIDTYARAAGREVVERVRED